MRTYKEGAQVDGAANPSAESQEAVSPDGAINATAPGVRRLDGKGEVEFCFQGYNLRSQT